jgi:tRNA pseudouridine32 synthase/23S rRNA pseudouridine746 synthase
MTPDELQRRVLYRDALMIIIDKPAGLPVHAGPGGGRNLEQYFDALRFGLSQPPALAHRLDRDTSGCLVLGRNRKGLSRLGRLFQSGQVEKTYWAVVAGQPKSEEGHIEQPLKKIVRKEGWRMVIDAKGQSAVTDYRVLGTSVGGTGARMSWIEFKPRTGRTHQIRVHAAYLGCPVLGDDQYGSAGGVSRPDRLHLHSRAVSLPLYATKPAIAVTAEPPPHMQAMLAKCGWVSAGPPSTAS